MSESELLTAIRKDDEENVRVLLERGIKPNVDCIKVGFYKKNANIINLLFKHRNYNSDQYYDTYQILINDLLVALDINFMNYASGIQAETIINSVIDNYKNNNVLDILIKHKDFNKLIYKLNLIRENFYEIFYDNKKLYKEIKDVVEEQLFSLIFRSCALTEVDELRKKLHDLGINEIDGKPINGIKSETDLCNLIEKGLKVDIHKYDDIDYTKIKPAIRRVTYDDDDDELLSDN